MSSWLASDLIHRHEEGYEYPQTLAPFAGSSDADISKRSRLDDAFLPSQVSSKAWGEVDSLDCEADSSAYSDRLFWGTSGNSKRQAGKTTNNNEEYAGKGIEIMQHRCVIR